jgi:hypothetical protein
VIGFVKSILDQGWVGSTLSFVFGVIGISAAIWTYKSAKVGPRPVYQHSSIPLLGFIPSALPSKVEIFYSKRRIDRITKTKVLIWNSGNQIVRGEDIVTTDPIVYKIPADNLILEASLFKTTRAVNNFQLALDEDKRNEVVLRFDYLDPGDGAAIEILHSYKSDGAISGTIRGVPRGIVYWGIIPWQPRANFKFMRRYPTNSLDTCALIILGLALAIYSYVAPAFFSLLLLT